MMSTHITRTVISHSSGLRQKSLGSSIMVSDFIDEVSGFLCNDTDEARLLIEDGYFTNEPLLAKAVDRGHRKTALNTS